MEARTPFSLPRPLMPSSANSVDSRRTSALTSGAVLATATTFSIASASSETSFEMDTVVPINASSSRS